MAGGDRLEVSRLDGIFGRDLELTGLLARLVVRLSELAGEAGVEPLLSTEVWAVVLEDGVEAVEVMASQQFTVAISGTSCSWALETRDGVEYGAEDRSRLVLIFRRFDSDWTFLSSAVGGWGAVVPAHLTYAVSEA